MSICELTNHRVLNNASYLFLYQLKKWIGLSIFLIVQHSSFYHHHALGTEQYWIGNYSEHVFINVFYFNFISYNMLSNTNINNTRQYHLQQYCVQSYCNGLLIWLKLGFYLCFDFCPLSNYKLKVKKGILNRLDLNMLISGLLIPT